MQQTLLNRDTVKGWLATSGAYDNLVPSYIKPSTSTGVATNQDVQAAIDNTFTPNYVKQEAEAAIDATYDWIDGKKQTIDFSIPVQDKRQDFINNLITQIEPRLAKLPRCPTRTSPDTAVPTCIPQGMSAHDLAAQVTQLADGNTFLNQPLTQDNIGQSGLQLPNMNYLPKYASYIRTLATVLPLLILLCAAGYILLSTDKLRGWATMSRRLFFQTILIAVLGGVMWYIGSSIDISAATQGDQQNTAVVKNIVNPVLQHVLPDISKALVFSAGGIALVAVLSWLTAFILRRNMTRVTPFSVAAKPTASPMATPQQATPAPQTPPSSQPNRPQSTRPGSPPKISL